MVRKSNFELLRIISMMMIIGLHYFHSEMGGAIGQQKPNELNFYITYFLEGLFHTSVNCYILITGYFMANKKEVSYSLWKVLERSRITRRSRKTGYLPR